MNSTPWPEAARTRDHAAFVAIPVNQGVNSIQFPNNFQQSFVSTVGHPVLIAKLRLNPVEIELNRPPEHGIFPTTFMKESPYNASSGASLDTDTSALGEFRGLMATVLKLTLTTGRPLYLSVTYLRIILL